MSAGKASLTQETGSGQTAGMYTRLAVASLLLLPGAARMEAQRWQMVWSDEFSGAAKAAPSAANWSYDKGAGGWGNGELETYCEFGSKAGPCDGDQPNSYLDGEGHLVLKAIHGKEGWTSARLISKGKREFQYGRIEARMKLPVGAGFWPAFWMLGATVDREGWPRCGEQDILEWVQKYGPTTTSSTVHGPGYSGAQGLTREFTFPDGGRVDDGAFHTYGEAWSKDSIKFYRDDPGMPYLTVTPASLPGGAAWVYNQPFFLILNFAIGGGGFAGKTNVTTPGAGSVLVDFVRVYRARPGR